MEDDLSLYDEEQSLFESGASIDDTEAGSLIGAREDIKLMNVVRAIVILVLLTIAFISAETVFVIATIAEQNNFRAAYNDATDKLIDGFLVDINSKLLTAASFATELTSGGKDMTWPNVTYEDFEVRSYPSLKLSKSSVLSFSPIILSDKRASWESYAASVYPTWSEQLRQLELESHPYDSNFTSGVTYFPTSRVVSEGIYRFVGASAVTQEQSYQVTFPLWQMSPSYGNASTGIIGTMFDQSSNQVRGQTLDRMVLRRGCVMSTFLYQDTNGTDYANYSIPRSFISYPILQNMSLESDVAASLNMEFRWEPLLSGILSDYTQPLSVVVQNSCGESFTYNVTGLVASYAGKGSIYAKDVDGYTPANTTYDGFAAVFAAHGGAPINSETACFYKLNVYSTKAFKKSFLGSSPQIYKGIVLILFLSMVAVFIAYDCLIEKRQKNVVQAAERSDKIVRSLFPEAIRDRLYEDAIKKEEQHKADKNNWKSESGTIEAPKHKLKKLLDGYGPTDDQDGHHGTDPIADFFPNCTVLFADIAGFTAWSSEREPAQVFTLLETIYKTMDKVAKRLKVFKVETVGDCYVAATGIPIPQENHVVLMVRFARTCVIRVSELTKRLESQLGPGTGELSMRFGIHSGPVTAGVLRGQKARFQLFGDTMNMAARMESTGMRNKVQLSSESAKLLMNAGHQHWVTPRAELVQVKGKGECQTYWLAMGSSTGSHTDSTVSDDSPEAATSSKTPRKSFALSKASAIWAGTDLEGVLGATKIDEKLDRLIDWNVEVLVGLLKSVVARSNAMEKATRADESTHFDESLAIRGTARDEINLVISLPGFDAKLAEMTQREEVPLDPQVARELRDYVSAIASGYKRNEFHNFEHASHVILSSTKLLKRIVAPSEVGLDQKTELTAQEVYEHTYGISNDPLAQFAVVFSALIHDVGHKGVPNGRLGVEEPDINEKYDGKSLAEQRSVDIAWKLLMLPYFQNLRRAIYSTKEECKRFRALLVNSIMATDIFDKDLKNMRNTRWDQAFHCDDSSGKSSLDAHRKATIVIEHIIQASDVAHTMQHWHIYVKWNERLFREMYTAYLEGRSDKDPSEGWYGGEIWFYDNYVIPLAGKLRECGVFGVSSDEYLNYAQQNRYEWERKGRDIVESMKAKIVADAKKKRLLKEDRMDAVMEDGSNSEDASSQAGSQGNVADAARMGEGLSDECEVSNRDAGADTTGKSSDSLNDCTARSTSSSSVGFREIQVPSGKLGITLDSSNGQPIVYTVDNDSPMVGILHPGDALLAIDDIDTTSMSASAIAAFIGANAGHSRRFLVQSFTE